MLYQRIYQLVRKIPKGKVATYGQIAGLLGSPRGAQTVGWALHVLPANKLKEVPWHRVINREGRISTTCQEHTASKQAYFLRRESVKVTKKDGQWWVDLKKYLWQV